MDRIAVVKETRVIGGVIMFVSFSRREGEITKVAETANLLKVVSPGGVSRFRGTAIGLKSGSYCKWERPKISSFC